MLDRVAMVMLPHDWVTWRLTGEHVTDRGDASGTGWFDPTGDSYVGELLEIVTGDGAAWMERLPRVLGPSDVVGRLTPAAGAELGLPEDTVVGPGTGDNAPVPARRTQPHPRICRFHAVFSWKGDCPLYRHLVPTV